MPSLVFSTLGGLPFHTAEFIWDSWSIAGGWPMIIPSSLVSVAEVMESRVFVRMLPI